MMRLKRDFVFDLSLVLYLPLYNLDGDSFMSKDAYGHLCTVTGALWRPDGRHFDGVDDVITVPDRTAITNIFDGGGTAMAWINPGSDGEADGGTIVHKISNASVAGWRFYVSGEVAGLVKLSLYYYFSGDSQLWSTNATAIPINTWSHVAVTYTATAGVLPILYVNGIAIASGTVVTTGTRKSDAGVNMEIGDWPEIGRAFDGKIDHLWLCRRKFTPLEIQHVYLATKGRYK